MGHHTIRLWFFFNNYLPIFTMYMLMWHALFFSLHYIENDILHTEVHLSSLLFPYHVDSWGPLLDWLANRNNSKGERELMHVHIFLKHIYQYRIWCMIINNICRSFYLRGLLLDESKRVKLKLTIIVLIIFRKEHWSLDSSRVSSAKEIYAVRYVSIEIMVDVVPHC